MKEPRPQGDPGPDDRAPARAVRFEATIHAGRKARSPDWIDRLDVDRVPDPKGRIRALLTADDCVRLLDQGFEIRLHHAHPVRPLDPSLIQTDESVRRWLDERLQGIARATDPAGSGGPEGA
jgi:hypothetical protein